jgi:hypothetical protein
MRVGRKPFVEEIKNEGKQQHDDQDRKNRPETQLLLMDRGAAFEFVFAPGFHDGLNSPGPGGMPERLPSEFHRDQ